MNRMVRILTMIVKKSAGNKKMYTLSVLYEGIYVKLSAHGSFLKLPSRGGSRGVGVPGARPPKIGKK